MRKVPAVVLLRPRFPGSGYEVLASDKRVAEHLKNTEVNEAPVYDVDERFTQRKRYRRSIYRAEVEKYDGVLRLTITRGHGANGYGFDDI